MSSFGKGKHAPNVLLTVLMALSLISCSTFFDEEDGGDDTANRVPTVALTASVSEGPMPLSVTFTANATDPDGDDLSYAWSEGTAGNSSNYTTTFTEPSEHTVSVTVSDGQAEDSASVTITATAAEGGDDGDSDSDGPNNPDPENDDDVFVVEATPGGPVPWGVRYFVKTVDTQPEGSTLSMTCGEYSATDITSNLEFLADWYSYPVDPDELVTKGIPFSCIHTEVGEDVTMTLTAANGSVIAEDTFAAEVESAQGSVPFEGEWRLGTTDTFNADATISEAESATAGSGVGMARESFNEAEYAVTVGMSVDEDGRVLFETSSSTNPGGSERRYTMVFVPLEGSEQTFHEAIPPGGVDSPYEIDAVLRKD